MTGLQTTIQPLKPPNSPTWTSVLKWPDLTLHDGTIKLAQQHKFLGVIVTNTLSWSVQITHAIAKGTAYILQLKRLSSVANGIPLSLMCQLYRAVAVPKMLYTVDVWFRPTYIDNHNTSQSGSKGMACTLEKVQCTALLSIMGAMRSTAMDTLEIHSNIWPLTQNPKPVPGGDNTAGSSPR